ncbi:hypothetical protein L6R46_23365 [Myxococcota bacterium]|nr:hypothetical protein [Myxococcota bacterium]
MSRIRINPDDERRGLAAYRAALEYQRHVESTPAGRRSLALRNQAHPFANRNQDDQALPLYKEALAILPDDDSAATCSARSGVDRDNLLEARRLLERCLTSPVWRSDPKRVAAPPCRRGWTHSARSTPGSDKGSPVQTGMDP